jgi:hypothetical protein
LKTQKKYNEGKTLKKRIFYWKTEKSKKSK